MDIRSFFNPGAKSTSSSSEDVGSAKKKKVGKSNKIESKVDEKRKKKSSKKRTFDSDSDEEPLPPKLRKTASSKAKVIKESDDDDDDVVVVSVKKKAKEEPKKPSESEKKKVVASPKLPQLKPTSAVDFFGSTPISQKSKPSILKKKQEPKENKEKQKEHKEKKSKGQIVEDIDIFDDDDDDFEKSILDLETFPGETATKDKNVSSKRPEESKSKRLLEESPIPSKEKKEKRKEIEVQKNPANKPSPQKSEKNTPKKSTIKSGKKSADMKETETPTSEKKKFNYAAYRSREGPRELGTKELPEGGENCLEGLTFVITGVLESIERDEAVDLVKRYGGKVTSAISKKTSYLIVGRDAGESKIEKAKKLRTKQLDEDGLFDLIKKLPGKKSKYEVESAEVEQPRSHKKSPSSTLASESKYFKKEDNSVIVEDNKDATAHSQSSTAHSHESPGQRANSQSQSQSQDTRSAEELLWVDKYKPKVMKDIIGQQGDKSNAKKLLKWLKNWNHNNANPKGKGGFFAGKEDGSIFKCALLSGPPGVGKTTTAGLVCKEANFSFVELNASDTRSKKTLQQVVSELLSNTTVDNMFFSGKKQVVGNHALIMDEVDGMAGNEDRGGVQELISLIKNTKIPIICMCNDRNHPKIRSLANYCFDLRFYKPKVDQIKGFAMTISCREKLKIPTPVMEQIVIGANQDIRQVLHNLQMWTSTKKSMTFDEAKIEAKNSEKNIKIGPFDIIKRLFSASEKLSIHDKTDLFFNDYSFVPLFVQENYLGSHPIQSRGNMRKTLELTSKAADAIADSNLIEKLIRGEQNWSLLPLQGFFSCVYAPDMMRGGMGQRIEFPQWLGKNSSTTKHDRILQELKVHMRLSCLANKADINLDYLWLMRNRLIAPLTRSSDDANKAAKEVIDVMDSYNLTREDWESFMEIGKWPSMPDLMSSIPSKVKAAFTRTYNKGTHITPYASQGIAKKSKRGASNSEALEDVDNLEQTDEEDDVSKDSMIKIKSKSNEKGGKRKMKSEASASSKKRVKK